MSSELLSVCLLGAGQMAMMTGYLGSSNVLESVLRSVNAREPSRIDAHAGYYGQALIYGFYTLANLVTPSLRPILGSKRMLIIGSALFTFYQLSFIYLNWISFYLSAALMGIGYAVFYTGHGGYLAEHSRRLTLERNSALAQAFAYSSMVVGGMVLLLSAAISGDLMPDEDDDDVSSALAANNSAVTRPPKKPKVFRVFSDSEICYMFAIFGVCSLAACVVMFLLPTKQRKDSLNNQSNAPRKHFLPSIAMMLRTMGRPPMLLLAVYFLYLGIHSAFVVGVYPTTFTFNKALSPFRYLPALSLAVFGVGDVFMGLTVSWCSRRINNFGLIHSLVIGVFLCLVSFALIFASTPKWAAVSPTDELAPFIQPTPELVLLISFLFGLADACVMTCRTIICAVVLPARRDQAFAINKFYQSLASAAFFFASPSMSIPTYLALLTSTLLLGATGYLYVAFGTARREKKTLALAEHEEPVSSVSDGDILQKSEKPSIGAFSSVKI